MDYNRKIPTDELLLLLVFLVPMIYFKDVIMYALFWFAMLIIPASFVWHLLRWYFQQR